MLEGSLREFTLQDIFQLLALTKKSGVLRVTVSDREGRVSFREGSVAFAVSDTRRGQLGARIVSAGLISEHQLRETLDREAGEDGTPLPDALVAAGLVDRGTMDQLVVDQIQDAVFTLMRQDDGAFVFDADATTPAEGVTLTTGDVVAECARRLDEWEELKDRIPAPHVRLALRASVEGPVTLSAGEWHVVTLIDGTRTVSELIDLTGQGEFSTSRLLAELTGKGLVEARDPRKNVTGAFDQVLDEPVRTPPEDQQSEPAAAPPKPAPPAEDEVAAAADGKVGDNEERTPVDAPITPAVPTEPLVVRTDAQVVSSRPVSRVPDRGAPGDVDRAQVARELASLGLDDDVAAVRQSMPRRPEPKGGPDQPELTRDEEVDKGLLLRLIDGVKGA
jgi:hypothetical protein